MTAQNWGLGRNVLAGVSEALERFESVLVWEDDLICVPGTYNYLCSALRAYRNASRVMSVTGWTNRHLIPADVEDHPYFDGRAECWVWGTWRRAWQGMMDETALEKIKRLVERGGDPARYGGDLPFMAKQEQEKHLGGSLAVSPHAARRIVCVRLGAWWSTSALAKAPPMPSGRIGWRTACWPLARPFHTSGLRPWNIRSVRGCIGKCVRGLGVIVSLDWLHGFACCRPSSPTVERQGSNGNGKT